MSASRCTPVRSARLVSAAVAVLRPRDELLTRSDAVLRVGEIEPGAGLPQALLVAVRRDAAGVMDHPRQVQQVPGEKRRVAVREVIVGAAEAGVEVARPRAGLAQPARVG